MNLRDPNEFEEAYRLHSRRVRAAAQRILRDAAAAEDVAQDVFVRLWQRPELFDCSRGSLEAFLSVMARSRALDRRRADGALDRAVERFAALEALTPRDEPAPGERLERADEREQLRTALLRLPDSQREALTLAYARGLSSAEIADRTHVGRATARSRVRLGIGKLRADLGDRRAA